MGLFSKLFGGQATEDYSNSEEYEKLVKKFGKSEANELIKYWIQYYYMKEYMIEERIGFDSMFQILDQVMGELDRKKGVDFRKRVASLGSYCDEKKLAKEIDAFKLFDNDKSGKYHWIKDTVKVSL